MSATAARRTGHRLLAAGALGLVGLVTVAPGALAEDDLAPLAPLEPDPVAPIGTEPVAPEASDPGATPSGTDAGTAGNAATGTTSEATPAALVARFGTQKYRVGVQLADGSYVPAGTTTVGTTFTITETAQDGTTSSFTCTTTAATTREDGSTFCPGPNDSEGEEGRNGASGDATSTLRLLAAAVAQPGVQVDPDADDALSSENYVAPAGATISVALTGLPSGLRGPTTSAVIDQCTVVGEDAVACFRGDEANAPLQTTEVTFSVTGLPPVATDDSASTTSGQPVDIVILENDDPVLGAPVTDVALTSAPTNGAAELAPLPVDDGRTDEETSGVQQRSAVALAAAPAAGVVRYTPAPGFVGTDAFTYAFSTPNGTATATVRVVVDPAGGPGDRAGTPRPAATTPQTRALPDTGGPGTTALAAGAALVTAGTLALHRGRREARAAR